MKSVYIIIILAMLLTVPCIVSASDTKITASEIDELTYQFDFTQQNGTSYRWVFGDGATSTEVSPVHEYQNHAIYTISCEVELLNGSFVNNDLVLDATLPLVDSDSGNVNVGDISVPGGLLFLSSLLMFSLAASGNHIVADLLGGDGKDIMCFLYTIGIIVGGYLVLEGMYTGGI